MRLHKVIPVALALFALPSIAFAYPIPPQPLRKLCMESQFIVVATVEGLASFSDAEGDYGAKASLRVSSVLKGRISKPVIEVVYSPNMICPAPPEYPLGSTVIAFLNRPRGEMFYTTHGLSYGAKVLSGRDLEVYAERIREMLEILKQGNSAEKEKQIVEWLVRCAEEPATRWEGAYELSPGGDFMSFYEREQPHDFASMLTLEHRTRLSSALFRSTTISSQDLCLIHLIKEDEGKRLVPFILKYLKTVVNDPPYHTDELMSLISAQLENEETISLAKEFSDTDPFDDKQKCERRRILTSFIFLVERLVMV